MLGRAQGTGWGLGLHASVFSWKLFSEELLVQGHSKVLTLLCTWGIKETWGLYGTKEPLESEMAGKIRACKPEINCFANSSAFIPRPYSL